MCHEAGSSRKEAGSSHEEAGSNHKEAGSSHEEAGSSHKEAGSSHEEAGSSYQKYQFEVLNEEYVLRDVLGQPSPDGPYILASRVVDVDLSTPLQNADSTMQDDGNLKDVSAESLDGSPMKLQNFFVDSYECQDTVNSPQKARCPQLRKPLSMGDTRRLVSQYTLHAQTRQSSLPLWVLCEDATEPCVCMGVAVTTNKQDRTEIHLHDVSCHGPTNDISKVTDFKKILSEHVHRSRSKHVQKQCVAEYNILESVALEPSAPQKVLLVETAWNKVTSLLQSPPLDAKICVAQCRHGETPSTIPFYPPLFSKGAVPSRRNPIDHTVLKAQCRHGETPSTIPF
ncbi:hypothetical protein LSAT2_027870 [Lamellibrachia satsuma]|nr:hypothetical protein LSAT2_027870 [Lamellibrachia satsuma]